MFSAHSAEAIAVLASLPPDRHHIALNIKLRADHFFHQNVKLG